MKVKTFIIVIIFVKENTNLAKQQVAVQRSNNQVISELSGKQFKLVFINKTQHEALFQVQGRIFHNFPTSPN